MKKLTLIFIAVLGAYQSQAQNINPESDHNTSRAGLAPKIKKEFKADKMLSNWCLDVNVTGGVLLQDIASDNVNSHYKNAVNGTASEMKFTRGTSIGIDAEINYFFNKNKHWGLGTGLWYMAQNGQVSMDNFHVEFQSTDYAGNTFRQVITANHGITESLNIRNFNIPLLLKYKVRCSKTVGFTADAGLMFNLVEKNVYSTDASFDYEAIYKLNTTGSTVTSTYDNAVVPGSSDLLITKNQYLTNGITAANVQNYFNTLRAQGNNVGLGVRAKGSSDNISYKSGSVGFLFRPAVSFYLSDRTALNFGAYYLYQNFQNSSSNNGQLTNKVGSYNSMLGNASSVATHNIGVNIGVRFYLCKAKEMQVAVTALEPAEEKEEEVTPPAPVVQEEKEVVPDVKPVIDVSTPILFDHDRTVIKKESYPILEEAVNELNENKNTNVEVHGYTDNTGTPAYNKALSIRRAAAVKKYLHNKGVNPKVIKTIGNGAKNPAASNKTAQGRAMNRRAVMKLKVNTPPKAKK
ncbi:MAG: cell envelope biosis protein OmpA [Flavipsychrobacter sp.]|nr:cell envelope biosis protein OmpA [Flavipsychrobacter sp.]